MNTRRFLSILAGLWIIVSAFCGFSPEAMAINLLVVGMVVLLLGLPEKSPEKEEKYKKEHDY